MIGSFRTWIKDRHEYLNVIANRIDTRSIIITSQLPQEDWHAACTASGPFSLTRQVLSHFDPTSAKLLLAGMLMPVSPPERCDLGGVHLLFRLVIDGAVEVTRSFSLDHIQHPGNIVCNVARMSFHPWRHPVCSIGRIAPLPTGFPVAMVYQQRTKSHSPACAAFKPCGDAILDARKAFLGQPR